MKMKAIGLYQNRYYLLNMSLVGQDVKCGTSSVFYVTNFEPWNECKTRMHSSRMHATCSSSRPWWGGICLSTCWNSHSPGVGLKTSTSVGLETPWPDPSTSPLGVGMETCKPCWDTTHPPRDLQDMLGYLLQCMLGSPCGQNDRQVQKYYLAPNFVCRR